MCRNIKTLRAPYAVGVTDEDVRAAALQFVRTVGGFRLPAPHNADAFNQAVDAITAATRDLLVHLEASPDETPAQTSRRDSLAQTGRSDSLAQTGRRDSPAFTRNPWRFP
jgi:hypothetical protein